MCELDINNLENFYYENAKYYLWYIDKKIKIGFSQIPEIKELIINKNIMTKEEIKEIKKKPFKLLNNIKVYLEDIKKDKVYVFEINKGYRYDGASIPKFAWRIIGSKEDTRFQIASLLHDYMCENHEVVNNDRYFADRVFEKCCYTGGTCAFVRWLMFHSVDNYQKFCGWENEEY